MHPDFATYDPLRSPAWRCDRTMALLDGEGGPHRPRRGDDTYVCTFHYFLSNIRCVDPAELAELQGQLARPQSPSPKLAEYFEKCPGLWYAYRLHFSPDRQARTITQARILAREDDRQIAARCGSLPDTYHWYEKIFFNVRDRIDNPDWIRQSVLSPPNRRRAGGDVAPAERRLELVLKACAYVGGSSVLDAMLAGVSVTPASAGVSGGAAWLTRSLKTLAATKSIAALAGGDPTYASLTPLLKIALESGATDGGDAAAVGYEEALKAALAEIPWEIALRHQSSAWEKQFEGAAEPRSAERLMIAAGIPPPDLVEYYKQHPEQRKYPDLPLGDASAFRPDSPPRPG